MNKLSLLFLLFFSLHVESKTLQHKVQAGETAWLLSSLYYGSGARFADILKANDLMSAESVKPGMILKIENPKFAFSKSEFEARRAELLQKRAQNLGFKKESSSLTPFEEAQKELAEKSSSAPIGN